tara:strand:+ start:144 stop:731 length:588 start_codon:yes stop_codon:yes gene_type:complete
MSIADYGNSIIYKICCNDIEITDEYVGSTGNFTHRKKCHKSSCNNSNGEKYNLKVYRFIREHGGFQNWSMIEMERYNAIDEMDLKKRERYYIELLKSSLNSAIPTRTYKEYNDDNKENHKRYYQDNKEKIKQYLQDNKETIKLQKRQYQQDNKEKIKQKFNCGCGGKYTHTNKTIHEKTSKHQKYINQLITRETS